MKLSPQLALWMWSARAALPTAGAAKPMTLTLVAASGAYLNSSRSAAREATTPPRE